MAVPGPQSCLGIDDSCQECLYIKRGNPLHPACVTVGLPQEAVQDVYKAAITKAGEQKTQQQLSNGFVAALTQINDVNNGQELLDNLLSAVEGTIKASGCKSAEKFTQGGAGLDRTLGMGDLWRKQLLLSLLAPGVS